MNALRSLVPVGLFAVLLGGVGGCKKDEDVKADPASASTATASAHGKLNIRNPMGPVPKIDPQTMKDYRLDVCYYGTLSLRQARDAYLGSLGKDEPSEKKLPSFGVPQGPSPTGAPPPTGSAAAKPALPTAARAAGSSSAGARDPRDRKLDMMLRAPHERNARACTAAVALKEPAMPDVDTAVLAFAPFAVDLAKDITMASGYYQREEYKKDSFAKGKELDKKLRDGFAKLDELQDKLGVALNAWRTSHPADPSKMEEGEKFSRAALDDARDAFMLVVTKKADGEAYKAAQDKLAKSVDALRTFATSHQTDSWAKIVAGPFEGFMKALNDGKPNAEKTFDGDALLSLVSNFTGLIEARQRAISRAAMAKAAPPPAPAPAPGQPPQ